MIYFHPKICFSILFQKYEKQHISSQNLNTEYNHIKDWGAMFFHISI